MNEAREIFHRIQEQIQKLPAHEFSFAGETSENQLAQRMANLVRTEMAGLEPLLRTRLIAEFEEWGPLTSLMQDEDITEIIVNGPFSIWFEKEGCLQLAPDHFLSELSFRNCVDRMCLAAQAHITVERPCADGKFLDFRLSIIGHDLTHANIHICLRRHPRNPWTFERLLQSRWCNEGQLEHLKSLITERKNFLVVGGTGAGKTSVLNSFMRLLGEQERVIAIEDTPELALPNTASMKLLTREDPQGILPPIIQSELVKRSLRLRPDRIVMGEVRGPEAKDFLMALATGHAGSFGTLHAQDPHQALIRLEMLIQIGAPQWSIEAVRRLIQLSLDTIVVAEKTKSGQRRLKGIYKISSLESNGFLLDQLELS